MNDAFGVCSVECVSDLDSQRQQQFSFEGTSCDPMLQGDAIEKLHHDEQLISMLPDLVNGAVPMIVDLDIIDVQADLLEAAANAVEYSAAKDQLQAGANAIKARATSLRAHIENIDKGQLA